MELLLVFGPNVPLEVLPPAECLIAVLTLMRPLTEMDPFDMNIKVTNLRECFRTMRTVERLLLGVAPNVPLEA